MCDVCTHNSNAFEALYEQTKGWAEEAQQTKEALQNVLEGFHKFIKQQTN
jgi:hypothetical protein